jgi:hypothetical protein
VADPGAQGPADIDSVLADPDFHSHPIGWRLATLRANYPEFAALNPKDQGALIAKTQQDAMGFTAGQQQWQDANQPKDPGFWNRAADIGKGLLSTAWDAGQIIANPAEAANPANSVNRAVSNVGPALSAQASKAKQAVQGTGEFQNAGPVSRAAGAVGHGLASVLPVVGPAAADTGEELGSGQYGAAAADAAALLGPSAVSYGTEAGVLPKVAKLSRTLRNLNNPTEDAALAQVAPNVRMTPWQRAGMRGTEKAARNLTNMPGSAATKAEDFYAGQQQDIAAEAQRTAANNPTALYNPSPTDDLGAGQTIEKALQDRITRTKGQADQLYDSIRKDTANNVVPVQTGSTQSAILHPTTGQPITMPTISQMETPVPLDPIRARLQSVYDDLNNNLPDARKASSPAWVALKNLMESPKSAMNAMDFDKFLGALKSITRDGEAGELSNQSAGVAKQVIQFGEQGLNDALMKAGPDTVQKLTDARAAVRDYHDTNDFLQDVRVRPNEPYEPAAMYRSFVRPKDASVAALQELQNRAPQTIPVIGQTYLQGLFDQAMKSGGWSKSAGVRSAWERLGPNTRRLLYGPQQAAELDKFFHAAEMLTPAEGSPTAGRLAAITSYGDVGLALGQFLRGAATGTLHGTVSGAAEAAGLLGATRGLPAILAKLSFKPAGAELLHQALTVPINSPAFNQAMMGLNTLATQSAQQQQNDPLGLDPHLRTLITPSPQTRPRQLPAQPPGVQGVPPPPQ